MQSSAMVALRTTTMIVCLVAVPLAAVLGTTLPKVVKSAFGHNETRTSAPATEPGSVARASNRDLPEAHPNEQDLPAAREMAPLVAAEGESPGAVAPDIVDAEAVDANPLPRVRITGVRTVDDAPQAMPGKAGAPPSIETAPLWNPSPRTANTFRGGAPTNHFVPADPPEYNDPRQPQPPSADPQSSYGAGQRQPGRRDDALRKTAYSLPDGDELPPDANPSGAPSDAERLAPVERVSNDGALAEGERRLRALGVKYYRLEPWGGDGAFYRCSCNVPFSPSGRATRHFDAIESAPSLALEAVVAQVEAWRAGRSGRGR